MKATLKKFGLSDAEIDSKIEAENKIKEELDKLELEYKAVIDEYKSQDDALEPRKLNPQ